jgi:hypothetical protein
MYTHNYLKHCVNRYSDDNVLQWPYFDYIGNKDLIKEFAPESDWPFIEFRNLVIAEQEKRCYLRNSRTL